MPEGEQPAKINIIMWGTGYARNTLPWVCVVYVQRRKMLFVVHLPP